MLARFRNLLAGARRAIAAGARRVTTRRGALGVLVGAIIGAALVYLVFGQSSDDQSTTVQSPAPPAIVHESADPPEQAEDLGFPAFATKNSTRIGGADPAADAAAAALAVFPSTGPVKGPQAVSIVDAADWQGGIAAASLVASPVGAPILLSDGGELGGLSADALDQLDPQGSSQTAGRQVFAIGDGAQPDGRETLEVKGASPAALAAEVESLRQRLAGDPEHVVVTTSKDAEIAMPAAAWAARSGDPVLFADGDEVPKPTLEALKALKNIPVYVLGPESAISGKAFDELSKLGAPVKRVGAEDPVENAVAFARYTDDSFGWNINDPGHGFVIAATSRPADAAAAAPLSASGTWGPLLVNDDPEKLAPALRGYLLDLKPGYTDDPTRALYNHLWLIGDPSAISVAVQAELDEIAELAPVRSGTGGPSGSSGAPAPSESEPTPQGQGDNK